MLRTRAVAESCGVERDEDQDDDFTVSFAN